MKPWSLCAEWYRAQGYLVERAEYRLGPYGAHDSWGLADLVVIRYRGDRRRIYVQAGHDDDVKRKTDKAVQAPLLPPLLQAGHRHVIMGWRQRQLKGKRSERVGRAREIVLVSFTSTGPDPLAYEAQLAVLDLGQVFRPIPDARVKAKRDLDHQVKPGADPSQWLVSCCPNSPQGCG